MNMIRTIAGGATTDIAIMIFALLNGGDVGIREGLLRSSTLCLFLLQGLLLLNRARSLPTLYRCCSHTLHRLIACTRGS